MNQATLVGNLIADPELRYTPQNVAVCSFRIATSNGRDKDGNNKDADYHNITVWGKAGEEVNRATACAQNLKKGMKVFVLGRVTTSSWEGSDGVKRSKPEIVASLVEWFTQKTQS
jgi:single-strand DNA-binding protein